MSFAIIDCVLATVPLMSCIYIHDDAGKRAACSHAIGVTVACQAVARWLCEGPVVVTALSFVRRAVASLVPPSTFSRVGFFHCGFV